MGENCLFRLPKFRDMPAIVALKFHNQVLGEMEWEPAASILSHLEAWNWKKLR